MAGLAQLVRLALMATFLVTAARGQDAPPTATALAPVVPVVPEQAAPSPKLEKLFAGTPPKFEPAKPDTDAPATAAVTDAPEQPRNGIVRLPTFIVRDNYRLPDDYHMLTPQARQAAVVKRYVGEPTGLDLMLNKYTINNTVWKKIPVLGAISNFGWTARDGPLGERGQTFTSATPSSHSSSTSGDRIALDYSKIEAKRLYTEALGVSADVPPTKAKEEKSKDEKQSSASDDK